MRCRFPLFLLLLLATSAASPPTSAPATRPSFSSLKILANPSTVGQTKATAFIFAGIDCPISNSYAPEINRIIADYSRQGILFRIVYCDAEATNESAIKHARDFGYTCALILDPKHEFAQFVHAMVTPEAVVLSRDNQPLYHGRIDDRYVDIGKPRYEATTHDLRDALEAIVHDRPIAHPVTEAVGCEL